MKRAASLFALSLAVAAVVAACASMSSPRSQDLVGRAVQAQGGAEALAGARTYYEKGTVKQWEPEQSMAAGGEMRFAGESTYEAIGDVASRSARVDWSRKLAYPAPREFTFTEVVTPDAGYVAGIDSSGRTKQSLDSTPPAHTMSGLRLAATQREMLRSSPFLLLEMQKNPARVSAAGEVTIAGVAYPAAAYQAGDQTLTVLLDPATGLPARVRTQDYDNIWGDVTYDLVLSDWQVVEGIRVPMTRKYELNGRVVVETKVAAAAFNTAFSSDLLAIPDEYRAGAPRPAAGAVPYQWVLRRQFIGVYVDSDMPSYDTRASTGLRLNELARGVQHAVGGTHHSLVVEMSDHLVVFDAPVSDWHSNWVLSALRAKYLRKPVKYLVLTHHHMDHAGGLRAYADQGATLVVGKGTSPHYRRVLAAPFTRNPDLGARDLTRTPIVEADGKYVITDGTREVHAYSLESNPHCEGMLMGYVPDARLGFVTDVWSPGAPLPERLNPMMAAVVATVKRAGISPLKFAGGHGSSADYAPLAALEGK